MIACTESYIKENKMTGIACFAYIYEYEGVQFEIARTGEPFRIKKDGNPSLRKGKKFLDLYDRFLLLPKEEKEKYKISGGCVRFNVI